MPLLYLFFDRPSPVCAIPMGHPLSPALFASPAHELHLKCSTAPAPQWSFCAHLCNQLRRSHISFWKSITTYGIGLVQDLLDDWIFPQKLLHIKRDQTFLKVVVLSSSTLVLKIWGTSHITTSTLIICLCIPLILTSLPIAPILSWTLSLAICILYLHETDQYCAQVHHWARLSSLLKTTHGRCELHHMLNILGHISLWFLRPAWR